MPVSLRAAAIAAAVYSGAVALMLRLGAADELFVASSGRWLARDGVVVVAAAATLVVAHAITARDGERGAPGPRVAAALLGGGLAWVALGVLDQHALGLFEVAGGGLGWDLAFHGIGVVAACAGWLRLKLDPRAPTPMPARRSQSSAAPVPVAAMSRRGSPPGP